MHDHPRKYGCLKCNSLVIICRHCDHGNIYCKQCAPVMYLIARRRANTRYQKTYQGRINHAARQKRYRERLKQKVTHQGSQARSLRDLLVNKRNCVEVTFKVENKPYTKDIFCHCCNKMCSPFLRDDWLRYYVHKKRHKVLKAKKSISG
jgi:hypothetical protein